MKRFMFPSIGVLCLAIAVLIGFHVGSQNATAQPVLAIFHVTNADGIVCLTAITSTGDVYGAEYNWQNPSLGHFRFLGNFWTTPPVATEKSTWSGVKGQFKK